MENTTKVITGKDTRFSFCHIWEPESINGSDPKYSVSFIIPKSDTVTIEKINKAIRAAYEEGGSKIKDKPGVVDAACQTIIDRSEVYSGVYGRASINFYAFNVNGNRGIACGLNNL